MAPSWDVVDLLLEAVKLRGPSGFEEEVAEWVSSRLSELGFEASRDAFGNVWIELGGGGGGGLVLAAHMDELGFLVTGAEESGLLTFRPLGGIDDRVLPGVHVELLSETGVVEGVIGIKPPHLLSEEERGRPPSWRELRIDIGASSREEAQELVKPLTPGVFKKQVSTLNRGRLLAVRSLDDRVGVAILLALAAAVSEGRVKPRGRLVLAWTVQEEVGLRGARVLAKRLGASAMVAVDTMACCDPVVNGSMRLGGGPVLRLHDNRYMAPRPLRELLARAAARAGVEYQVASAGGTTDAAAFMEAGVPSAAIGVPARYAHSTAETVHLDDVRAALRLVEALVEEEVKI